MKIEIIYPLPDKQETISIDLPEGYTVQQAISYSGVLQKYPDIVLQDNVGIFSKRVALDRVLTDGDRVEIYRPLIIDPKTARRQRAEVKQKKS